MNREKEINDDLWNKEIEEEKRKNCKHLRARIYGTNMVGQAYCPDCGSDVFIYVVLNNLMSEMRKLLGVKENEE